MNSENKGLGTVALTKCYYCGGDGAILIASRASSGRAVSEAHGKVADMQPCSTCSEYMKKGVIIITIDESKSDPDWNKPPVLPELKKGWMPNPYRAGGWFVVSEDFVRRLGEFSEETMRFGLKNRWMFMEHAVAEQIGLIEAAKDAPSE